MNEHRGSVVVEGEQTKVKGIGPSTGKTQGKGQPAQVATCSPVGGSPPALVCPATRSRSLCLWTAGARFELCGDCQAYRCKSRIYVVGRIITADTTEPIKRFNQDCISLKSNVIDLVSYHIGPLLLPLYGCGAQAIKTGWRIAAFALGSFLPCREGKFPSWHQTRNHPESLRLSEQPAFSASVLSVQG
ncbi:hypothetical protein SAMN05661003_11933 [Desulfuromonas thiophila]|uniref:Uncharacterized protein n=1 Tax=Desulfuromonas thiophila TaxID=57664 RepID=A0A1G7ECQ1_9BACT|nr:hypothetical protein SAMN05661003_11933 [Desulfuromonas thiophila]